VLVFLDPNVSAQKAKKFVTQHLASAGSSAELLLTSITPRGARPQIS
jgi:hypothetical protein